MYDMLAQCYASKKGSKEEDSERHGDLAEFDELSELSTEMLDAAGEAIQEKVQLMAKVDISDMINNIREGGGLNDYAQKLAELIYGRTHCGLLVLVRFFPSIYNLT
jgi:hypothetical protein